MGNVHLVTGYRGEDHVTAADMGALYAAIVGFKDYVLRDASGWPTAVALSANTVRIGTGNILMQGRHIRIDNVLNLTIANGAQGYNRIDTIACEYERDETTGIEDANIVVVKGTQTTGTATPPVLADGDIDYNGSHFMPLFNVHIEGITIKSVEPVFTKLNTQFASMVAIVENAVPVTRTIAGIDLSKDISALNLLAALTHTHAASEINSGTLSADRLPAVPIAKGGTGATNGATGLKNLLAAGATVLSSHQYGDTLPSAGTAGRIFFKKV